MNREEAIDIIRREIEPGVYEDEQGVSEAIDMAIEALDRQKGKWIEGDMLECNQCHHRMIVGGGAYNFCPNCGAKMDKCGDTDHIWQSTQTQEGMGRKPVKDGLKKGENEMAEMNYTKAWDYVKEKVNEMDKANEKLKEKVKEKVHGNPGYQCRMRSELASLKKRYRRLHRIIIKRRAGTLNFEPKCSLALLEQQEKAMGEYLRILEIRAEIEGLYDLKLLGNEAGHVFIDEPCAL